jgi:hypothetical protein
MEITSENQSVIDSKACQIAEEIQRTYHIILHLHELQRRQPVRSCREQGNNFDTGSWPTKSHQKWRLFLMSFVDNRSEQARLRLPDE